MKLIRPSYEIRHITPNAPQMIERAGRVCYKSEEGITPESAQKFCKMLYDRGHHSVLEHCIATVHFTVDRGFLAELTRHRLCSYSVESTRYCNYTPEGKAGKANGGHITFIIPPWLSLMEKEYKQGIILDDVHNNPVKQMWINALIRAEEYYNMLIAEGWKPEQARSVLPNSLKSEIVITANAREWLHIFKLRTAEAAHPQMRELMIPLKKELIPMLFGQDITLDDKPSYEQLAQENIMLKKDMELLLQQNQSLEPLTTFKRRY